MTISVLDALVAARNRATSADEARPRRALSHLVHLLRLEKRGLHVVLVYAIGIGVSSLAAPIGVQMLVSTIAFGGLAQPIAILSVLVLVALAFASTLRAAQSWVAERIQQRLFVRIATDLSARLPRFAASSFDARHGPELVNRFFDVVTLQKGAAMLLLEGIFVTLQVLVGSVVLALYHPALLAFAGGILVAIGVIVFGLGRRGTQTALKESKAKYALVAWFEEIAGHPTTFRAHGGDRFALSRSEALIGDDVHARTLHYRTVFRQTAAFLALQALVTAALLGVGGVLVLRGQLTLGQLVAAELIVTSIVAAFAKFGKYLELYYDLIAAMDKLGELVDLPLERPAGASLGGRTGPLEVRLVGVEFTHGARDSAGLKSLSLDIPSGARIALIGSNGSGKSTLIDLLFGLREPTHGYIEVDGLPMRDLSLATLRQSIALVRGAALFEGTVMENVCMGREDLRLEDVRDALERVGLWKELTSLPAGLGTRLTSGGGNLSAGQAQRLAIARAIVGRPRFLLLDEALDHLDPSARETVLGSVLRPDAPWTAIVATHDSSVATSCPWHVVLGPSATASVLQRAGA